MFGVLAVVVRPPVDGVLGVVLPDVGEVIGIGGTGETCRLPGARCCPGT